MFERTQRDMLAHFTKTWGLPSGTIAPYTYPEDVQEALAPAETPDANDELDWIPLGRVLMIRRVQMGGMSQRDLAAKVKRDPSQVSRAETTGKSPHTLDLLRHVAPDLLPPDDVGA